MSTTIEFSVGDYAWYVRNGQREHFETCPDCLGTKRLKVIMGNSEEVSIDCECCRSGYEYTGKIMILICEPVVDYGHVGAIRIGDANKPEYIIGVGGSGFCARKLFSEKEDAESYCKTRVIEERKKREEEIGIKRDHSKSWSWHVYYYQRMIRRAKQDIDNVERRLGIAKEKSAKHKKEKVTP